MFPYVENHNFYVEHWAHSVVWRKMRDLGRVLVAAEFFPNVDDVFLLSRHEVSEVLFDLYHGWAGGGVRHQDHQDRPAGPGRRERRHRDHHRVICGVLSC